MTAAAPTPLPVAFEAIPRELRAREQWVAWKYVQRGEKWTKPPVTPGTGRPALTDTPSTWRPAKVARDYATRHHPRIAGIGYVLSPQDDYACIDLDDCVDPKNGTIDPWASN